MKSLPKLRKISLTHSISAGGSRQGQVIDCQTQQFISSHNQNSKNLFNDDVSDIEISSQHFNQDSINQIKRQHKLLLSKKEFIKQKDFKNINSKNPFSQFQNEMMDSYSVSAKQEDQYNIFENNQKAKQSAKISPPPSNLQYVQNNNKAKQIKKRIPLQSKYTLDNDRSPPQPNRKIVYNRELEHSQPSLDKFTINVQSPKLKTKISSKISLPLSCQNKNFFGFEVIKKKIKELNLQKDQLKNYIEKEKKKFQEFLKIKQGLLLQELKKLEEDFKKQLLKQKQKASINRANSNSSLHPAKMPLLMPPQMKPTRDLQPIEQSQKMTLSSSNQPVSEIYELKLRNQEQQRIIAQMKIDIEEAQTNNEQLQQSIFDLQQKIIGVDLQVKNQLQFQRQSISDELTANINQQFKQTIDLLVLQNQHLSDQIKAYTQMLLENEDCRKRLKQIEQKQLLIQVKQQQLQKSRLANRNLRELGLPRPQQADQIDDRQEYLTRRLNSLKNNLLLNQSQSLTNPQQSANNEKTDSFGKRAFVSFGGEGFQQIETKYTNVKKYVNIDPKIKGSDNSPLQNHHFFTDSKLIRRQQTQRTDIQKIRNGDQDITKRGVIPLKNMQRSPKSISIHDNQRPLSQLFKPYTKPNQHQNLSAIMTRSYKPTTPTTKYTDYRYESKYQKPQSTHFQSKSYHSKPSTPSNILDRSTSSTNLPKYPTYQSYIKNKPRFDNQDKSSIEQKLFNLRTEIKTQIDLI